MTFLSPRQERFYQHTCDIWRIRRTTEANTKRAQRQTPLRVHEGVACHFETRQSVNTDFALGRAETDIQGTRDVCHLPEDTDVDEDDIIVNKTLDSEGNEAADYGRFYVVQGRPRSFPRVPTRDGGRRIVEMAQVHEPPEGVTVD